MPYFYSSSSQESIKRQIRQLLPWKHDCNIDLIAPNHLGERIFNIYAGRIYHVSIRPIADKQCFVSIT